VADQDKTANPILLVLSNPITPMFGYAAALLKIGAVPPRFRRPIALLIAAFFLDSPVRRQYNGRDRFARVFVDTLH
jgi:hypothetical protein